MHRHPPGFYGRLALAVMRNRAVTDTYEPGSTIKPFTVLAALETGRWKPGSPIETAPGYFRVGRKLRVPTLPLLRLFEIEKAIVLQLFDRIGGARKQLDAPFTRQGCIGVQEQTRQRRCEQCRLPISLMATCADTCTARL